MKEKKSDQNEPQSWPDLAIQLYDKLTQRNAEIAYQFDGVDLKVPSATESNSFANWKLDGTIKIRTKNIA